MKQKIIFVVFFMAVAITTSSCKKEAEAPSEPSIDIAAAKSEIEARIDVYEEALNSKDSVGLANCYTSDAKFMQPNEKTIEGRTNIQKLFSMWMKGPSMHIKINTVEVWGDENMRAAENTWTFMNHTGKTIDTGKSLEIYKKEDGVWKLHRDCYNSDMAIVK